MLCENCGAKNADNSKFCYSCRQKLSPIPAPESANVKNTDEGLAELNAMVGMTEAKKILPEIVNRINHVEGNHIVITGNPGTGKTSLARIAAKLFGGSAVECQGYDLKGAYIGQSKENVQKLCDKAMGGILFIDEAYSLVNEQGPVDIYAKEALDTLLERLQNDKGKFICIVSGYNKEMQFFLDKASPGMRACFSHFIDLPDYSTEELLELVEKRFTKRTGSIMTDDARETAKKAIKETKNKRDASFGNAHEARNIAEILCKTFLK